MGLVFWLVIGFIGGLILYYDVWAEGNDIDVADLFVILIITFLGLIGLIGAVCRVTHNKTIIKGKEKQE